MRIPTILTLVLLAGPALALTPEQWADQVYRTCQAVDAAYQNTVRELDAKLAAQPRSREDHKFLRAERRAASATRTREQRLGVKRLNYTLFGNSRYSFREAVAHLSQQSGFRGPGDLVRILRRITGDLSPCFLDYFGGVTVLSSFHLEPPAPSPRRRLTSAEAYGIVQANYRRRVLAGEPVAQVFASMWGADQAHEFDYPKALVSRFQRRPTRRSGTPAQWRNLENYLRLAAPVIRIVNYLDIRARLLEANLGLTFDDSQLQRLHRDVRQYVYGSSRSLEELRDADVASSLRRVEPVLAEWERRELLAARKKMARDPHALFWSYVQTAAVPPDFPLPPSAPPDLPDQTPEGLPPDFVRQFQMLEAEIASVAIPRQQFLRKVAEKGLPPDALDHLRSSIEDLPEVTALTLYQQFLDDVTRFKGSLDWRVLNPAMEVLADSKKARLEKYLADLPEAQSSPGFRRYLRNAGTWVIELEKSQIADGKLRISTGGGVVGWFLRRFVIGGGLPAEIWAPGGVAGEAFASFIDGIAAANSKSGVRYIGKATPRIEYVPSGQPYLRAIAQLFDEAKDFVNMQAFDWKVDIGGKEIAYRLMCKKLGITGESFQQFVETFSRGLPKKKGNGSITLFYDVPPRRMKNLVVYWWLSHSQAPAAKAVRAALERAAGGPLECADVNDCGDLESLYSLAGSRYDPSRASETAYQQAWLAFQEIQGLFEPSTPALSNVRPQRSLARYLRSSDAVRTLVRRHGIRRADRPQEPFVINILVDGKQDTANTKFRPSAHLPFAFATPSSVFGPPLAEFDINVVLWKGLFEFPWHVGPLPIPGRMIGGVFPIPYIPYPWLKRVPGFGFAGPISSLIMQHALATDMRTWWAMAMHSKNISNESATMQSGMGLAAKYMNLYPNLATWHDAAVVVHGPVAGDANDQFVAAYNRARTNNKGLPQSRGSAIPKLRYEDYRYSGETPAPTAGKSWILTTDPDGHDYNYRTIYMAALAAARESIYIENAFYTDPMITKMLLKKAHEFRGRVDCAGLTGWECAEKRDAAVKIYLVVPDHTDQKAIDAIGFSQFFDMIHAGVKMYRWSPRAGWSNQKMMHTKAWLVDYAPGRPSLGYVGSHNANQRSHFADNETGILSSDPHFTQSLYQELFRRDIDVDSRLDSRDYFEIERATSQGARLGSFLGKLLVDYSWFF